AKQPVVPFAGEDIFFTLARQVAPDFISREGHDRRHPANQRLCVPVGGGGLAAGVAVLIKQLMPQIKVIAVEAEDSACLKAALEA
ncbi:pyridoxal-phosphate dependent enzyme, partial [Salmonella enterica subsp. enterica serovar Anatum]|nr:pyridoxal-phosphate dependent enzyme [Salmonella enterica subsp. enterica serovar Anatum]